MALVQRSMITGGGHTKTHFYVNTVGGLEPEIDVGLDVAHGPISSELLVSRVELLEFGIEELIQQSFGSALLNLVLELGANLLKLHGNLAPLVK